MTIIPNPDAIWPGENYLICYRVKLTDEEVIVQSDATPDRAERGIDALNEHNKLNDIDRTYYWRQIRSNEKIPTGRRCAYI